jgi:hypothetical protein
MAGLHDWVHGWNQNKMKIDKEFPCTMAGLRDWVHGWKLEKIKIKIIKKIVPCTMAGLRDWVHGWNREVHTWLVCINEDIISRHRWWIRSG